MLTLTLTLFKGGAADDGHRRAAHGGRGAVATLEDRAASRLCLTLSPHVYEYVIMMIQTVQ